MSEACLQRSRFMKRLLPLILVFGAGLSVGWLMHSDPPKDRPLRVQWSGDIPATIVLNEPGASPRQMRVTEVWIPVRNHTPRIVPVSAHREGARQWVVMIAAPNGEQTSFIADED